MICIRNATPADAAALAQMNATFNGVFDSAELIAERLVACADIETPIVAELDGQVGGFACVRVVPCVLYAEPYAELTELYVEPAFRRRGVGRALIERAEQLARERGAAELIIMTGVGNAAAQALYRASGYDTYAVALNRKLTR
ncbi:MAG TPA: GNAT family N-acetyltransferase [Roseiflexaceae bacterium]|nr:GNAT family N-acetyltransferase [Roseiflexaceae bacterium]